MHLNSIHLLGPPLQPQVFVSFRGEELRCGFVSHLVEALQRHGVNVFIDRLERKGEHLTNLFVRIEESTIALVIFSRRYTESIWCLDELVKIKERADQGLLKVIPIFYNVEPITVKQLRGAFGDQFRDRRREYRCDKPRTERWKEALASISCKIGLTFDKKSNESKLVRMIVKEVERTLQGQGGGQCTNILPLGQVQMDLSRESLLVHEKTYIQNQIVVVSNAYMYVECENSVLRAQLLELSQRLHSLNSIVEMAERVMDEVHTIPHFLINPWQMSYSSQPTLDSADIFYL